MKAITRMKSLHNPRKQQMLSAAGDIVVNKKKIECSEERSRSITCMSVGKRMINGSEITLSPASVVYEVIGAYEQ